MANYDDIAFNAMGEDSPDFIGGGAISSSEYEQAMSPQDQKKYEDTLRTSFQIAYKHDPYRQNLDFTHWLKTLNPELVRERAKKWEDIRAESSGVAKLRSMDPREATILEDSGILQRLAHLHTGRVEDIVEIVKLVVPEQPLQPEGSPKGPVGEY